MRSGDAADDVVRNGEERRPAGDADALTCLPVFWTVLSWNLPSMIPASGEGGFREEVEVYGGADRLHSAPG